MGDQRTRVRILGEDGPPGQCTDLMIMAGGNGDWYIGVEGPDEFGRDPRDRTRSDMARFCTSGERCTATSFLIAMLFHVGCGHPERAAEMLDSLKYFLTEQRRYPDPDEADRAFEAARSGEAQP